MGAGAVGAAAGAVKPLGEERVRYLRKVYSLLLLSALLAVGAGAACLYAGGTVPMVYRGDIEVEVPFIVARMLENPMLMYISFGVLFVGTIAASAVSKVRVVNVIALMFIAALMGFELAPMVFFAQFTAGLGETMSATPVRDTFLMVIGVFVGITGYIFITRKDFSYLGATLSMGFIVIFIACMLTWVFDSEIFALAVACVGALFCIGMLLYVTSYIFRNSEMDDPVGDALSLLVQLRNLFMFILRIFMSSRS